jgi:hypothetical protein
MASASRFLHHSHSIIDHAPRTYGSSQAFHRPTHPTHKLAVRMVRARIFMQPPSRKLASVGGAIKGWPTRPRATTGQHIRERQRNIHLPIYHIIPLQAQSHPSRPSCESQLREPNSLSPSLILPPQTITYMMEGYRPPILSLRRSSEWSCKVTSEVR